MSGALPTTDVLIIGSGPSGVSAARPLVEAGISVTMLDAGATPGRPARQGAYQVARAVDEKQADWMLGAGYSALRRYDAVSPKLRVPDLQYVFDGFLSENQIETVNFVGVGSLAAGGLSNAWGCGVASLSDGELRGWPIDLDDLRQSYARVAKRVGMSGSADDAMRDYYHLDDWCQSPIPLDDLQQRLYARYRQDEASHISAGLRLGRSRVAALSQDLGERKACSLSSNCLWGCARGSLYTAAADLADLRRSPNFVYVPDAVVREVRPDPLGWAAHAMSPSSGANFAAVAPRVILAAGTLATTRLALRLLDYRQPVRLWHTPTAAFLLWLPRALGRAPAPGFGLGQLSFTVRLGPEECGFGSLFATSGIPVAEFARHVPLNRRSSVTLLRHLLSSCAIGNVFLPGRYSASSAQLTDAGGLKITGGLSEDCEAALNGTQNTLSSRFLRMRALMLPGSFRGAPPGADIHYAGTLPMSNDGLIGHTSRQGELNGANGVYVADAACFSRLSEKSHTLTMMANADRIATHIASAIRYSKPI